MAHLDEVVFYVNHWKEECDLIPYAVAKTIASYWEEFSRYGFMLDFACGRYVSRKKMTADIWYAIRDSKMAGDFKDTIEELDALQAWVDYYLEDEEDEEDIY